MVLSVLDSELSLIALFILDEAKRREFLLICAQNSPLYLNEDMLRCVSLIQGKLLGVSFPSFMLPFSLTSNILSLILISARPVIKMIITHLFAYSVYLAIGVGIWSENGIFI